MKTLHLSILIVTVILSVSLLDSVFAQTAVNELHATMDKLNYKNSDKPVITVHGYPHSIVDLDVYDSLSQDIFSAHIQISSSGVANYTLDISSYKVGIYSAQVRTSTDRVKISFAVGLTPTGPVLTLTTTKDHYVPEEIIDASGLANPNSLIYLNLLDPTNVTADSAKQISDNFGFFSVHFRVPQNAVNGTWRIEASSGTNYRVVDIAIISSNYFTLETKPSPKVEPNENLTKVTTPSHLLIHNTPLQQFKSGVAAKDVKCKEGLQLVIKSRDGSPACVKPTTAQKLVERGWAKEMIQAPIQGKPSQFKENETEIQARQTIPPCVSHMPHQYAIAGPPGASLCPIMNFEASTKILNATGFYGIYNYTTYPGTLNFVLEPGHNGTITAILSISAIHNYGDISQYSNQVNITNDVIFMHDAEMHNHPGVDVIVEPQSETIEDNGSAVISMTFYASKSALPGNYWVTLPTGVCAGGEMIILTIADCTK